MSNQEREIREIRDAFKKARQSLGMAWRHRQGKTDGTHEANIALHLAPPLIRKGFAVYAEVPLLNNKNQKIDFVAAHPRRNVVLAVESKSLWDPAKAQEIYRDYKRLSRELPRIAGKFEAKRWYGIIAAICVKRDYADWWLDDGTDVPKAHGGKGDVWRRLRRTLRECRPNVKRLTYGRRDSRDRFLLYAISPGIGSK